MLKTDVDNHRVLPQSTVRFSVHSSRLDTLNEDVLQRILVELQGNRRPLSLVCRWLRGLCIPFIFNHLVWGERMRPEPTPPQTIWPYIRIFSLAKTSSDGLSPLLTTWLAQMPKLCTIRVFSMSEGLPLDLIKALFSAPGLETLEIIECPFRMTEPYNPKIAPVVVPLRHFRYRRAPLFQRLTPSRKVIRHEELAAQLRVEALSLSRLISQMNMTIETLMIPGGTAHLDLMADLAWPHLRALTIYDVPPSTDTIPLVVMLSAMPTLRSLHLELTYFKENPRFFVCPPELHVDFCIPPNLTSFTMSWPSPDDQIFSRLPSTLRYLSLRDSPRVHHTGFRTGPWLPYLKSFDVVRIFKSNDFSGLERLELVYIGDTGEKAMLEFICTSLPSLRHLELHRLRPNRWLHDEDEIPIDLLGTSLSASKSLRILRVNLDPDEKNPESDHELPFDESADLLAKKIATLEEVSIFWSQMVNFGRWSTYLIDRKHSGEVTLLHQPMNFAPPDRPVYYTTISWF